MKLWQVKVMQFAREIQHGDHVHREWLLEAAEAFANGSPLPPPRDAKSILGEKTE